MIKRLIGHIKGIKPVVKSDFGDYFAMGSVVFVGLLASIYLFIMTAKSSHQSTIRRFESMVNNIHTAISTHSHNQLLQYEIVTGLLNEGARTVTVIRQAEKSSFSCALLAELDGDGAVVGRRFLIKKANHCQSMQMSGSFALLPTDKKSALDAGIKVDRFYSPESDEFHVVMMSMIKNRKNTYLLAALPLKDFIQVSSPDTPMDIEVQLEPDLPFIPASPGVGTRPVDESLVLTRSLSVLGQRVIVKYTGRDQQFEANLSWPWTLFFMSLLITSLLTAGVYHVIGRNLEIQKKVDQATKDLRQATEKAIEANQTKSRFLANVSHEVRTPLNLILGMADLLQDTHLTAEQMNYVRAFRHSGQHLLDLINDILDVARIEAGEMPYSEAEADIIEVMEGISDSVSVACRLKKILYTYYIDPEVPRLIRVDPKRLRQILINVINNAIKFTDKGQVSVEISLEQELDPQTSVIRIDVKDTGKGIAKNDLEKIFEEFYQADSQRARAKGGVGLGLAIVKSYVDFLKGSIEVESEVDHGSTFHIHLPVKVAQRESWLTRFEPFQRFFAGKKAFLLTANEPMARLIKLGLQSVGMDIDLCVTGQEALEKLPAKLSQYDCLLLDLVGTDFGALDFLARNPLSEKEMKKVVLLSPLVHRVTDPQWASKLKITRTCYTPIKLNDLLRSLVSEKELFSAESVHKMQLKDNLRLLIAEDDKDNQFLIQAYLSKENVRIEFADNGQAALSLYQKNPVAFDVLVTDVRMPVMDGFTLIENLREFETSQGVRPIPILVLTADAQPEQIQLMKEVGGNEYLTKPIARDALLQKISAYQQAAA